MVRLGGPNGPWRRPRRLRGLCCCAREQKLKATEHLTLICLHMGAQGVERSDAAKVAGVPAPSPGRWVTEQRGSGGVRGDVAARMRAECRTQLLLRLRLQSWRFVAAATAIVAVVLCLHHDCGTVCCNDDAASALAFASAFAAAELKPSVLRGNAVRATRNRRCRRRSLRASCC